ncbi:hypothetical protein ACMU_15550 [Actibacterium mucosum KCTC 23349]|uniref:Uncharacterized protein n=1 Tax=Actibacterium mucosum KCTC 23349 TaxID=1454373 RepID=A0A037ZHR5_9RHOB|nr:hypothetical protein [Actibacterium mucosum]KAJ55169.1 hypothetical protein ACMU_15550 [Actibacterium mucosum KCTC 23349]
MLNTLLIYTAILPLVLGVFVAISARAPQPLIQVVVAGVALLIVYYGLEGLPPFPPVASKHKLFYGLLAIGAVSLIPRVGVAAAIAVAAATVIWIGQRRLSGGAIPPGFVALVLPLAATWFAARPTATDTGFIWPVPILVWAIAGSIISVDGGYIGSGQVLGALAALTGGALLATYGGLLAKLANRPGLSETATALFIAAGVAMLAGTAFFAPKLSVPAIFLQHLVLVVPFFAPRIPVTHPLLRPVAIGVVSAIAAAPAVLVALFS